MPSPAYEPAHCIVCGHAESDVVAEPDDVRNEVELLWEFHERRLRAGTPTARLRDRVAFSQHPPFRLVACTGCGLVYRNPTERSFELESIYADDEPSRATLQTLHDLQGDACRPQAARLRSLLRPGATVLEVGSYVGAFLSAARDADLRAIGVDINPKVNAFTRSLGFEVRDGVLADVALAPVDAIAIWNTFDQLANPRGAVIEAAARLRAGGVLAIRAPNGSFYRRWRSRLSGPRGRLARTLLAQNNLLTFPYRWGFSPTSLAILLTESGFTVRDRIGDVLVPIADSYTRPWARIEERVVKRLLKATAARTADDAPWFEVYATAPAAST